MIGGEGIWLWQLPESSGGDKKRIVADVIRMKFDHVLVKVADGARPYATNDAADDYVCAELEAAGVQVAGWGFHYGADPEAEARVAAQMCHQLRLSEYVLNAEKHFEKALGPEMVERWIRTFREEIGDRVRLGLSTFALPEFHSSFPYERALTMDGGAEYVMPQVYTVPSQKWPWLVMTLSYLQEAKKQLARYGKPILPTLRAYTGDGKFNIQEIEEDAIRFLDAAPTLDLPGWNWWVWQSAEKLPRLWAALAAYAWSPLERPQETVEAEPGRLDLSGTLALLRSAERRCAGSCEEVRAALEAAVERLEKIA